MKKALLMSLFAVTFMAACSPAEPAADDSSMEETLIVASPEAEQTQPVTETSEESMMDNDVNIVEVEAGSFYFAPDEIRVKQGETVRISMTSVDMMHDFVIDELGVKIPVTQSGDTGVVEFVAETPGTYEYYCSVGNHRQQGQTGTLIVE